MTGRLVVGDHPDALAGRALAQLVQRLGLSPVAAPAGSKPHQVFTAEHVLRVQKRLHEQLDELEVFDRRLAATGLPGARLVDRGTLTVDGRRVWWALSQRIDGHESTRPDTRPARCRVLGRVLASWHRLEGRDGRRVDDPGVAEAWLAWLGASTPHDLPAVRRQLLDACQGASVVALHGDLTSATNLLVREDTTTLAGLIDPGVVSAGPAEFDLAWAAACEIVAGHDPVGLLAAYRHHGGAVDPVRHQRLLEVAVRRRVASVDGAGLSGQSARGRAWLAERAPHLLRRVG